MENVKGYIMLAVLCAGFIFVGHKLVERTEEIIKKDKVNEQIRAVNEEYTTCSMLSTASFIGAVEALMYQQDNDMATKPDRDNTFNYAELRQDQRDDQCLETKRTSLQKLGVLND